MESDEKNKQRQKANQRANRKTKAPMINNTAKLQETLYKAGFFDKGTTFNKAVDGIRGEMTDRAI
jgi:SOS response regulatory protein OraA/RecX